MGNMAHRPSFSRDPGSSFLSKVIYCAFDKIFLRVTFLEVLFKTAKASKRSLSEDLASCYHNGHSFMRVEHGRHALPRLALVCRRCVPLCNGSVKFFISHLTPCIKPYFVRLLLLSAGGWQQPAELPFGQLANSIR